MKSKHLVLYTTCISFVLTLCLVSHARAAPPMQEAIISKTLPDGSLQTQSGQILHIAGWVFPESPDVDCRQNQENLVGNKVTYVELGKNRYGDAVVQLWESNTPIAQWPCGMVYSDESYPFMTDLLAQDAATTYRTHHDQAANYLQQWRAVYGTVHQVALRREMGYLNFGDDYKTDFTIMIPPVTLKQRPIEYWQSFSGKSVLVRGLVYSYNGPAIMLFNPQMLQEDAQNNETKSDQD